MSTQPTNQPEFSVTTWAEVENLLAESKDGRIGSTAYRIVKQLMVAEPGVTFAVPIEKARRGELQKKLHFYNYRFNGNQRQLHTRGIGDVLYVAYIEKLQ